MLNNDMQIRLKSILPMTLIFISIFLTQSLNADDELVVCKGTLAGMVSCKEGVVLIADTRITNALGRFDTFQKIRPIKSCGMFVVENLTMSIQYHSNDPTPIFAQERRFDINEIIDDFFNENDPKNIDQNINQLKEILSDYTQKTILPKLKYNDYGVLVNNATPLYQVIIFIINHNNNFTGYKIMAHLTSPFLELLNSEELLTSTITPNMSVEPFKKEFFKKVIPCFYGNNQVANEILDGEDSRFNDVRKDPDIVSIRRNISKDKLSRKQAIRYLKKIIKVSSDRLPIFDIPPVSSTSDCAILTPTKGFRWIDKVSSDK